MTVYLLYIVILVAVMIFYMIANYEIRFSFYQTHPRSWDLHLPAAFSKDCRFSSSSLFVSSDTLFMRPLNLACKANIALRKPRNASKTASKTASKKPRKALKRP